jgi:hypothetical protein
LPLAIKRCDDKSVKQKASDIILDDFNLKITNTVPLVVALKMAGDKTKIKKVCDKILESKNVLEYDFSLIAVALRVCPNKELQCNKAVFFIENSKKVNWEILYQSIKSLELREELPLSVHLFVDKIITDFYESINSYRFLNISQIELHSISSWKQACEHIINNWKEYHRTYISYVLYSHRFHPLLTKQVSKEVLENWRTEIVLPIKLVYGKKLFGYHVFNAIKNPLLDKEFVMQIAMQIKETRELNEIKLYGLFSETIDKIIDDFIFRTWTPKKRIRN